jgi:hypothetical protein
MTAYWVEFGYNAYVERQDASQPYPPQDPIFFLGNNLRNNPYLVNFYGPVTPIYASWFQTTLPYAAAFKGKPGTSTIDVIIYTDSIINAYPVGTEPDPTVFSGPVKTSPTIHDDLDGQNLSLTYTSFAWAQINPTPGALTIDWQDKAETRSFNLTQSAGSITNPPQTGRIHFTDTEPDALPTGSIDSQTATVTDTKGNMVQLTSAQTAALEAAFSIAPEPGNTNNGAIDWTYNPDGTALSFLTAGEAAQVQSTIQVSDQNGNQDTATVTITLVAPVKTLFTTGADRVDFNSLTSDQQSAIAAGTDLYNGLGGSDSVTLPNIANYKKSSGVMLGWDTGQTFQTGSRPGDNYQITGGDGSDKIQLGAGNDTVYGSPGSDSITGGTGADTFNYQLGSFGNFKQFATPGTTQTITGGHLTFAKSPTQQNVLLLPGSPNNYSFSVNFGADSLAHAQTTVSTTPDSGFPKVSLATTDVEAARFAQPLNNPVTLSAKDSPASEATIATEAMKLAADVYGSSQSSQGYHSAQALAYPDSPGTLPYEEPATGNGSATSDGWLPVSAMQLGIAPADFMQQGTLRYSYKNGFYAAIDTKQTEVSGSGYPEANATVLQGVVDKQTTLAITFRGTDQVADFVDYANFSTYYEKFKPLVDGIENYLQSDDGSKINQVIVSGHSLGAAAVQYLVNDLRRNPNKNSNLTIMGYTDGSPGSESPPESLPIINFVQVGDPVPKTPTLKNAAAGKAGIIALATIAGGIRAGVEVGVALPPFQPKTRVGLDVVIDAGSKILNPLAYHKSVLYADNVGTLSSFAKDPNSPFASSKVGLSLTENKIADAASSNAVAPGATDGNEIAVGSAVLDSQGNPQPSTNVRVNPNDNYVLGSEQSGDKIFWDNPQPNELVHVVDGGKTDNASVDFLGSRSDYRLIQTNTSIGTVWQVYFLPNGPPGGKLIGDLYRIENDNSHIFYTGGYGTSVTSSLTGNLQTGQTTTLLLSMSGPVVVNTLGGSPTLTLSQSGPAAASTLASVSPLSSLDPVTATYDASASDPGSGVLAFQYKAGGSDKFSNLQITSFNANGSTVDGVGGASVDFSTVLDSPIGLSVNSPLVVTSVSSPQTGVIAEGQTAQLTLSMNESLSVNSSGGLPTLTLNDGGTAAYNDAASNPSSGKLAFDYTVQPGESTQNLAISGFSLPVGTTVQDAAGYNANFSAALNVPTGIQVGAGSEPAISKVTISPASGAAGVGKSIALALTLSGNVTVTGSPTLALNDGGIATYDAGKSTSTSLAFDYTVGSADADVDSLAITQVKLNGGTIRDGSGDNANLSFSGLSQSGPQIDNDSAQQAALALTVNGGHPIDAATVGAVPFTTTGLEPDDSGAVSFSDGSHAPVVIKITGGVPSATSADLAGLNDGHITATLSLSDDAAGNSFTPVTTDVVLDKAAAPSVSKITISPASGVEGVGKSVVLALTLTGAVTVAGSPVLTLNDGGAAVFNAAKSTSTSLAFDYTVGSADTDVASLAVTQVNLNGGTIRGSSGRDANLSLSRLSQSGPQIDNDSGEQAALTLTVNGSHPIDAATASAVSFTVAGLEPDDNGTVSFSDGSHAPVVIQIAGGAPSATTADLAGLNDGNITATLSLSADAAGNSFTPVTTDVVLDADLLAERPTITARSKITLNGGKSLPLGIALGATDSDDTLSISISGVAKFQSITAAGATPTVTRHGSHYTYTFADLPASDWDNGLILHSSYKGKRYGWNHLTVTVSQTTPGDIGGDITKKIAVTNRPAARPVHAPLQYLLNFLDPRALATAMEHYSEIVDPGSHGSHLHSAELLSQYMASSFVGGAPGYGPIFAAEAQPQQQPWLVHLHS